MSPVLDDRVFVRLQNPLAFDALRANDPFFEPLRIGVRYPILTLLFFRQDTGM
ncbi:hypothetical protein D3C84_1211220 [compost metagenome]